LRVGEAARALWVVGNVAAWIVAIYLFVLLMGSFSSSTLVNSPAFPSLLVGAITGLAVGGITSLAFPLLKRAGNR
jgi:hypothetical protein